jgi:hypothetical protein
VSVMKVMLSGVGGGRPRGRQLRMALDEELPQAGQYVFLGADASSRFAQRPIMLLLVAPAQPTSPETSSPGGQTRWWILRGWQLSPFGEPQLLREVRVRAGGVEVVPKPPAVGLVGV